MDYVRKFVSAILLFYSRIMINYLKVKTTNSWLENVYNIMDTDA